MAVKIISFVALLALIAGAQGATVYATAKKAGLTTLVAAIDAANFKGSFNNAHLKATVFAPTNEAFDELIAALNTTAADLLKQKPLLRKVLKYHLFDGVVASKDITSKKTTVYTWLGQPLKVQKADDTVTVFYGAKTAEEAQVVTADVKADRSIVHVINKVLVPV